MSYEFLIEDMIWSFSRLNSFYQCPWQFKLQYIDCNKGEGNFFAEFGTKIHGILEDYAKGKLEIYELADTYEKTYTDTVIHKAPPNKYVDLNQKYYDSGYEYLMNFEGFGNYEIVAAEKEINFKINNINVKGYIDLLLKDKEGNFIIADHKSSAVKSKTSEKAKEYIKQMTLYAIGIYEEYGVYPKELHINAFRENKYYVVPFNINEVENVKQWVLDTVNLIMKEEKWLPKSDNYFCNWLCNFRGSCEYRPTQY